ncbi:hypothetical protein QQS21_011031 [Conoideocrella luteorostrata]|uniref:NACHT domain-containing protein n=1 Tax=Conoideocrella luteorostrata TaxID=1105319 RepID=A0AAJ0CE08_9HYPO|nr:hypothetical protein QQS21_011031 [Conoideocrella luteorostrata]
MAAVVASVNPASSKLPPVGDFLRHAIAIYQSLVSAHRDDQVGGTGSRSTELVGALMSKLSDTLAALRDHVAQHNDDAAASLTRACHKVGQDLLLKLDRLRTFHAANAGVVAPLDIRVLWPVADVQALGERLYDLVGGYSDETISFKTTKIEIASENDVDADGTAGARDEEDTYGAKMNFSDKSEIKVPRKSKVMNGPSGMLQGMPNIRVPVKPKLAPASVLYDFLLESLAYKTMHDREEEVVQAHESTFEWVFKDQDKPSSEQAVHPGRQLGSWLSADALGPIYWITGKPGSGKSTFMRHLFQNEQTQDYLSKWAKGQPVSMAGFFFWTSGSRDQRSQTGMLRSLLHQLLSSNMELIPETFPELWSKLRNMTTKERIQLSMEWPVKQLLAAFRALMEVALPSMKICLFIDGLDEFDGDHITMINFFKDLGLGKHGNAIKMCLSSRPWSVFENAFEHAVPHMKLQDLTYEDMHRYTRDKLRENMNIRRGFEKHTEAGDQLVRDTVHQADGVFLWVRLAVNEMIVRWDPDADIGGLASILVQIPPDLNDVFAKLLFEEQTASEVAQTSMIFQLIRAREVVADFIRDDPANSLTVWEMAFALNAEDDVASTTWQVEEANDLFITKRSEDTISRITHRFARLLDLHCPGRQGNMKMPRFSDHPIRDARVAVSQRVTYIHRTVRDWLMEAPGVQEYLTSQSPPEFDPHLRLLRSYVLRLKRPLDEIEHHRRLDEWWPDIALALTHARYILHDANSLQRSFVNELNKTLSWHWLEKPQDPYDHWARNAFGSYETRMKASPIWQPFLCLTTKFGLTKYLSEEVDARNKAEQEGCLSAQQLQLQQDDATPLLAYATEFICSRQKTIFPLSDPCLVEYLLRHACRINPGPNHEYSNFFTRMPITPWLALLRHLRDARRRGFIEYYDTNLEGTARWAEIVRLFLDVGSADPHAVILADGWDPECTALGVLELLEETYGAVEVVEMRELMIRKLADKGKEKSAHFALRSKN